MNDQDRRTYAWLCDQVGEAAIAAAVGQLSGQRKPYLSNIAKVLGIALPRQLAFSDPSTAAAHIRALRARLAAQQSS